MRPYALAFKFCLLACLLALTRTTGAQTESVLFNFTFADGANPYTAPIFDKSGHLFGVTPTGGQYTAGEVYELTLNNGVWQETTIYSFCPDRQTCTDGSVPNTNLVFDAEGNLYGTALGGNGGCGNNGCGVVFKLTPSGSTWTESVLYTFSGGVDGAFPWGTLVFDKKGHLYGTTEWGGKGGCNIGFVPGCGTVFELSWNSNAGWTEKVLYSFQGLDGDTPLAGVILDSAGNVYGTTAGTSPTDPGLVFRLTPTANGWKETVLYRFTGGVDGSSPQASLARDNAGNLYGTTRYGGGGSCNDSGYTGCGVVFVLSSASGRVRESVIHQFQGGSSDGAEPAAGVTFDRFGGLDGTTAFGGATGFCGSLGCGTVFRITRNSRGKISEALLHKFDDSVGDGAYPLAGLTSDSAGNLYSTTQYGGANNWGTVFEISR